jgi:hypothetical protein
MQSMMNGVQNTHAVIEPQDDSHHNAEASGGWNSGTASELPKIKEHEECDLEEFEKFSAIIANEGSRTGNEILAKLQAIIANAGSRTDQGILAKRFLAEPEQFLSHHLAANTLK